MCPLGLSFDWGKDIARERGGKLGSNALGRALLLERAYVSARA